MPAYTRPALPRTSPRRGWRQFFTQEPDGSAYRIQKTIRDMLIFSEQDAIKDPPFSRVDLISCRNLLIYMGGELQKKLIPLFHYALNPGGFLFLGTSETVGEYADLFATLDRQSKVFLRKDDIPGTNRPALGRLVSQAAEDGSDQRLPGPVPGRGKSPLRELAERKLLEQYAPAAVLVDERGEVLYVHGHTGKFLEPAPGEAGMNIVNMAREGLRRPLASALHKAVVQKEAAREPDLQVKTNGDFTTIHLAVKPLAVGSASATAKLFLVVFEDAPPAEQAPPVEDAAAEAAKGVSLPATEQDARIAALRHELRAKEEHLQSTNEELETTNEELKSSNEEMQSVNEELRSTNEELETAKEELQSVNEELATVNAELQQKVADLSRANNDMNNLLAGTGIGTIFVDHQLRILRFTPAVTQVINLILTDIGRPVSHIVSNLVGYDRLVEDVRTVLNDLIPKEVEVQTKAGTRYALRIRPYRTLENVIEGAVITFVDTTQRKQPGEAPHEPQGQSTG